MMKAFQQRQYGLAGNSHPQWNIAACGSTIISLINILIINICIIIAIPGGLVV